MTPRSRFVVLFVSTPILAFAVVGGILGRAAQPEGAYKHLRVFEDVVELVTNNYVEPVNSDKMMRGALRGLADGLDPDTAYLSADEVRALESGSRTVEGGVGVELTRQYYLRIIAARDGSPAARAGLATGDFVRAIDGRSTRDMSVFAGARLLAGPPGSKVTLTVLRGSAAEPHQVELVRERQAPLPLSTRVQAPGVGYVRIPAFAMDTAGALRAAAADLQAKGATALVIDLRGTAEGPLDAGIAAARLLVRAGTLVQRDTRGAAREPVSAGPGDGAVTLPVVLLSSHGTAGAAELFAAALVGTRRAELVGERTLGRAALQRLVKLPDGSGLWLSTTRYLTASGDPIHLRGLQPAIETEEPTPEFGAARPAGRDATLDRALAHLQSRKAA